MQSLIKSSESYLLSISRFGFNFVIFALLSAILSLAQAACGTTPRTHNFWLTNPKAPQPGITPSTPLLIGSTWVDLMQWYPATATANCYNTASYTQVAVPGTSLGTVITPAGATPVPLYPFTGVYDESSRPVPGFAIAVLTGDSGMGTNGGIIPISNSTPTKTSNRTVQAGFLIYMYLYQVGPVPPGNFTIDGDVSYVWGEDSTGNPTTGAKGLTRLVTKLNSLPSTCTPVASTTSVPLKSINNGAFTGQISTAGDTRFTIQLKCSALTGKSVWVGMSDSQSPTNTSTYLTNQTGSTYSSGVGVKITRYNAAWGSPFTVVMGPEYSATSTSNQWNAGLLPSTGTSTIPLNFSAAYTQTTAEKPTPGNVSAIATITLNYR